MKNFLESASETLASWNIHFPNWSGWLEGVVGYFTDLKGHKSPWYVKMLKVTSDTFDMVTYNAYAFMGMLLCALFLF